MTEQLALPEPDPQETLARLDSLARNHLLFFRLEVGRLMLELYFGGDPERYHSQDPRKPSSFATFLAQCKAELQDLGLGETVLRRCILTHLAVQSLPAEAVGRLPFTHVVELSRVEDSATRSLLALATLNNRWTSRQLHDAIQAVRAGRWIDGDPAPGLQPLPVPEPEKSLPAGRVLNRIARSAEELESLTGQWRQLQGKKLSGAQKSKAKEAILRLKAQLALLEQSLDERE
ncbi:MAG TPA: hypothetical protein PLA94_21230 [Myxococcota bacterium]|nr:hypothetical protein [Myxococcota bacterium]